MYGFPFRDEGRSLPIGRQDDGYSCGICVINAMEHAVFAAGLFTPAKRHSLRVRYFTEIARHLLGEVRSLSLRLPCNAIVLTPSPASPAHS